jgi:hypothetical protein
MHSPVTRQMRIHPFAHIAVRTSVAAALLGAPGQAMAQRGSSSIEATVQTIASDSTQISAVSLAPILRVESDRVLVNFGGVFSQFGEGAWTTQGNAAASLFLPARGAVSIELLGSVGAAMHDQSAWSWQGLGGARLHIASRHLGTFTGASGGRAWNGLHARNLHLLEGGAWWSSERAAVVLSASPHVLDDSIRFTDAQLALRMSHGMLDVVASASARSGWRPVDRGDDRRSWGSIGTSLWLTPWAAIVGSAGTYPIEPVQGYPGGRFGSVGLRFGTRTAALSTHSPVVDRRHHDRIRQRAGLDAFSVEPLAGGRLKVVARASGAARVEIMGSFTGWRSVPLTRGAAGEWSVTVAATPGEHEVNVRVDGGQWLVPPGLALSTDDHGVAAGKLLVQ